MRFRSRRRRQCVNTWLRKHEKILWIFAVAEQVSARTGGRHEKVLWTFAVADQVSDANWRTDVKDREKNLKNIINI
jgi:hypothetical protein